MNIEMLGWFGTGFQMLGVILSTKKKIACWYMWLVSNAFLCSYALLNTPTLWPVLGLNLFFVIFNIYGIIQWRKPVK